MGSRRQFITPMSRLKADLLLLFTAAVWGVAFLFQKSATAHIGPLTFLAMRGLVAFLALAPLALAEGRQAPAARHAFYLTSVGGGGAFLIAGWLQQAGLKTATVTNTGFLTALYVVITPLIVLCWSGKMPNPLVWPAVAMSAVGTWLLGGGELGAFSLGDLLVAISAVFWAVQVVITANASRYRRPIGFTTLQFAVVAVLGGLAAIALEPVDRAGLSAAAVEIAFVGLFSSALTFTLLTIAMQHTPPSEAAIIVGTETLFAAGAAYLWLGERLSALGWVGAILILAASLLVQLGAVGHRRGAGQS
ncbi:MAG TPA: DMT family transporter [Hyphomicrobiaceae bacterium]|nr:DMT family transporter [Hyphomicrobiaceae bacterium]